MAASGALGVIKGITARWDRLEMFIFDDRLVVVRAGSGEMLARTIAMQFGLIGMLIYGLGGKSRQAATVRRRQLSVEQLLALDSKNSQIMVRDIVDARLSSGLLTAKLSISLVDGTARAFSWAKGDNEYRHVIGFLQGPLATRLIDEKKAA